MASQILKLPSPPPSSSPSTTTPLDIVPLATVFLHPQLTTGLSQPPPSPPPDFVPPLYLNHPFHHHRPHSLLPHKNLHHLLHLTTHHRHLHCQTRDCHHKIHPPLYHHCHLLLTLVLFPFLLLPLLLAQGKSTVLHQLVTTAFSPCLGFPLPLQNPLSGAKGLPPNPSPTLLPSQKRWLLTLIALRSNLLSDNLSLRPIPENAPFLIPPPKVNLHPLFPLLRLPLFLCPLSFESLKRPLFFQGVFFHYLGSLWRLFIPCKNI